MCEACMLYILHSPCVLFQWPTRDPTGMTHGGAQVCILLLTILLCRPVRARFGRFRGVALGIALVGAALWASSGADVAQCATCPAPPPMALSGVLWVMVTGMLLQLDMHFVVPVTLLAAVVDSTWLLRGICTAHYAHIPLDVCLGNHLWGIVLVWVAPLSVLYLSKSHARHRLHR